MIAFNWRYPLPCLTAATDDASVSVSSPIDLFSTRSIDSAFHTPTDESSIGRRFLYDFALGRTDPADEARFITEPPARFAVTENRS